MVVVALLSVDLVESVDLVSVDLVVNCSSFETLVNKYPKLTLGILYKYTFHSIKWMR